MGSVVSEIDRALWDDSGLVLGQTVYRLSGGRVEWNCVTGALSITLEPAPISCWRIRAQRL